jgi:hypothetical protein
VPLISIVQEYVLAAGAITLFVVEAWALVDAVSRRPQEFEAAGKQTKTMWLVILGVALAAHLLIWHPISLLNMAGAVASIVYLVDVRPAIRSLSRR